MPHTKEGNGAKPKPKQKRNVVSARAWAKDQGYRVEYGMLKPPQKKAVTAALIVLKNEATIQARIAVAEGRAKVAEARASKLRAWNIEADAARKTLADMKAVLAAARETMERPFRVRET